MSVMRNFNKALAQQNEKIDLQSVDNHGATMNSQPENEIHVTTTFAGEEQHTSNSYTPIEDPSFDTSYMAEYDINKFLSRPVLIGTYTMTQGSPSSASFNVWQLYFNTAQIRKKLDNYFLLNCNLKVKMVVNSTPFMYGAVLASYEPLTAFSADNVAGGLNGGANVLRSQRPHIWIYPQTNQGGEMLLPFYYYQEWLDVSLQGNLVNMGILTLEDVIGLRSASGATAQTVTVQIYAWAENVRLAGPTYSLALQNDEYEINGPVSAAATSVTGISDTLGKLPVIGKYFKATSAISTGIGKAASLLGFTNVPNIEPTKAVYIQSQPTFASSEISFPEHKLTYDPKNELTIDPRVVGLNGVDEMDISNIVQRESYLTNFTWTSANAVNTTLFNLNIRPTQRVYFNSTYLSSTPMGHLAQMFEYWRGDIIVRFRFICSQYHRGRVRITWDPNGDIINNNDSTPTSITNIVDIAETTDVEIRIPYMQPTSWCRNTANTDVTSVFHQRGYLRNLGFDNGNLAVKVFTNQTSQVSSADISVLVSVRGAENLEFANPRELPTGVKFFALQNDEYALEAPTQLGVATDLVDTRYITHIGEAVRNLRTILRRRVFYRILPNGYPGVTNKVSIVQNFTNRLPVFPGYDPNGQDTARNNAGTANVPYNWVKTGPYQWLASCYLGCRGSVNYYYIPTWDDAAYTASSISAQRIPRVLAGTSNVTTLAYAGSSTFQYSTLSRFYANTVPSTNSGSCETVTKTSASLAVQYPFYSRFRMRQCDPTQAVLGSSLDDSSIDNVCVQTTYVENSGASGDYEHAALKTYFGVGTDFSFLFFLNVPVLYVYADPVAPV